VFSLARNKRLRAGIESQMQEAAARYAVTGKPARVFTEFFYQTHKSWSRSRRVVAKAEQIEGNRPTLRRDLTVATTLGCGRSL